MNENQEQAVTRLSELLAEFDAVARDERKDESLKVWGDKYTTAKGREAEIMAETTSLAVDAVRDDNNKLAAVLLTTLKNIFEGNAVIYTSRPRTEKKEEQRYRGYSQKAAEVMKLL